MRDKDFINISENNNEDNDFVNPMKASCSAEFSDGCIFCNED